MWCGWLRLILLLWLCICFCLILSVLLWQLLLLLLRLLDESSILCCVVGATAAALHPQHVERHCAVGLAVVTYNLEWGKTKVQKLNVTSLTPFVLNCTNWVEWNRKIGQVMSKKWASNSTLLSHVHFIVLLRSYFDGGTLVFSGHRWLGNLFVYLIPVVLHVPGRVHTQRAAICSETHKET